MRCLITGGAGFLGSALSNELVGMGHQVRVLDDLSAGEQSRLDPRIAFVRGDIRDIPKLWTLLRGVDCVYHLAARVYVQESILYPVEYNDVNVGGTVSLMTAARDAGVRRVILASSGAVYGEQDEQPAKETAMLRPQTPYAVSKMAAEGYVQALGALNAIETVILRIFNAYGPGQVIPPSNPPVIPKLLKQALTGGSLVIYGQGTQTRDFIYISDVVQALIAAATAPGISGAIINVGSGRQVSINDLAGVIEEVVGHPTHRLYSNAQTGGVYQLVADISLARKKLGFKPKVELLKGLQLLLEQDPQFAA
ncbi:MAG: NAD-dependent epimerase/dehydratase family protein [Chloroflexi bacterium]|mgnify:FL=1|nr:NAD-dependent epimerase/dehydratase family protein [Chloroflexota bacterium]